MTAFPWGAETLLILNHLLIRFAPAIDQTRLPPSGAVTSGAGSQP
jgi:hypothetical protein